ncbi:MAG: 2TM domain-containing protein [Flavobacteriaceae bacterium]
MEVTNYTKEQLYLKAQKKVKEIKGFYAHLFVMIIIIPVIIYVNLEFTPEYHWFWYAVIGNLVGFLFHWFGVFGFDKFGLGKNWEEKKIRELMENDNERK